MQRFEMARQWMRRAAVDKPRQAALGLMFFVCAAAWAQVDYATATLAGTVFDPHEKVVAGAKITVTNQATGASRTVVSSEQGYQIPALAPAIYIVEIEAVGFAKSVARDVVLTLGETADYDVHLSIGTPNTVLEVVATIPATDPEQTHQADMISNTQVENLPNVTRDFMQSVFTVPGIVSSFGPALQDPGVGTAFLSSGVSIGGSNGRNNLITIDGGENDYGSGTLRVTHVPMDSIQEIQVNRNSFGAEFGFTVGSAINMVTKSGGNSWHGSAAAYFHNHATDAENFFNKLLDPVDRPFEQSAIFNGTLGGPIRKNRLFFFTAPEFQKLDSATVQNIAGQAQFQPISSQTNGYNAAAGACPNQSTPQQQVTQLCYLTQLANSGGPLSQLGAGLLGSPVFGNPFSNPILKSLVTSNDGTFNGILAPPGVRGIPGFNTPRARYANWVSRLDFVPGPRDNVAVRFSFMHETDDVAPQPPFSTFEHISDYTLTASWAHVYSSSLVNTARAQLVPRSSFAVHAPAPNGSEIDLGNQTQLGTPFGYPYDAAWKRFQFDDSLSYARGGHTFKVGFSYRPDYYDVVSPLWFGGQWQFADGAVSILNLVGASLGADTANALASYNMSQGYPAAGPASTNLTAVQSYLAGAPVVLFQADQKSNAHWSAWANYFGAYAQDAWRISPRLTVNYGVRFDYSHDPAPVPRSFYASPRVGLAFDVSGDQKTILRLGGGMFVGPTVFMVPFYANLLGTSGKYINQNALVAPQPSIYAAWATQAANATPAFPNPRLTSAQLEAIGAPIQPPGPAAFGNIIYTMAPNFKPQYTIQASAALSRQIRKSTTLELSYLMYHSVHIEQVVEANFVRDLTAPVNPFAGPAYVPRPGSTAGEPNPFIFQNNAYSPVGSGIYHGGTASLTRRLERGLQFQVSYTYSRSIDNTSDFSSLSTPFRPDLLQLDRALSYFNISHNVVASAVYRLPFQANSGNVLSRVLANVTLSPIVRAHSGLPFTLLVPGLSNGTVGHNSTARPWYEGRNNGVGPDFASVDLRLSKEFFRRDSGPRVEFIAQAQNLFNRTNFAAVNDNFPADPNYPLPNGGTLANGPYNVEGFKPTSAAQLSTPLAFTAAYPARQISLALRVAF
jgi:outer membrane receptor protein involved in Fe transport